MHIPRKLMTMASVIALTVASFVLSSPANADGIMVYPGDTIYVKHGENNKRDYESSVCTAGPIIKLPNETPAILTAGHCGEDGDVVSWKSPSGSEITIGTLRMSVNRPIGMVWHDYAIVPISVDNVRIDIGHKRPPTGFMSVDQLYAFRQRGPIGICSVGAITGSRCGDLDTVNTVTNRILSNLKADHGDSGGPVFIPHSNGATEVVGILRGYDDTPERHAVTIPVELALNALSASLYITGV